MFKETATILFIAATFILGTSLHSIDLAWNMQGTCIDHNMLGTAYSKTEMYKSGFYSLYLSFMFFFSSFILLLFSGQKKIYNRLVNN